MEVKRATRMRTGGGCILMVENLIIGFVEKLRRSWLTIIGTRQVVQHLQLEHGKMTPVQGRL